MILTPTQKANIVRDVEILEKTSKSSGFGFKRFNCTYRKLQAYHNKALSVVVKKQNFILDDRTPMEVRVPTTKLKNGWVLQPLLKKVRLKEACHVLRVKLADSYANGIFPDLHTGNVGWFKNSSGKLVPLLFDW
jgi:hypothetical protein